MQAFFANSKANDHISLWSNEEVADYEGRLKAWEENTRDIRDKMEAMLAPARQEILDDRFNRYYPGIREQLAKPPEEQTPYERQMYAKYKWQMEFLVREPGVVAKLDDEQKEEYKALKEELAKFEDLHPGDRAEGVGIYDLGKQAPPTHVLGVGSYKAPKQEVQPGFPTVLNPGDAEYAPPSGLESTGRRTAPGKLVGRSREPADDPRDSQSSVALPFRARHRGDAERLRRDGRAPDASRTARLDDQRVYRTGLEPQETASAHDDVPGLSAELGLPGKRRKRRTRSTACCGVIGRNGWKGR